MLDDPDLRSTKLRQPGQWRFVIGGVLIVAAVIFLIISSTQKNAQYFLTVQELKNQQAILRNKDVRISGAVKGSSIFVDKEANLIRFTLVNIPGDQQTIDEMGGIVTVLHQAVHDSTLESVDVIYAGGIPDLLIDEAQAIVTGTLGEDGVFRANELLLKCPSRYAEDLPDQIDVVE